MRVSILTISDRSFSGVRDDISGPALTDYAQKLGWKVIYTKILPDEVEKIKQTLIEQASSGAIDLIITTGGTGFAPRDNTPEATLAVIQKRTPGLVEKMRMESSIRNPHAILSRSEAGIRDKCLIINLPGNPTGALESLEIITPVLPHAISLMRQSVDSESGHKLM
ncbi:MAG: molybdenum cofactor biosynthesis protein [Chlorobiaceae bacterium]|nr:molybdenum cofactor biosynthesis protein [Chlorobiaceae bacterium]